MKPYVPRTCRPYVEELEDMVRRLRAALLPYAGDAHTEWSLTREAARLLGDEEEDDAGR